MSRACDACGRAVTASEPDQIVCLGCRLTTWLARERLPVRSLSLSAQSDPQAFAAWLLRSPDSLIARQRAYLAIVAVTP